MKLLANENFPLLSSKFHRSCGHDGLAVGTDFMGYSDRAIIELANEQDRTILTFDADYGELIFKHNLKPKKGVIYLRIYEYSPSEPGEIINKILSTEDFQTDNTLTVIQRDAIRQRKY
ncbi:hypothetical protein BH09BAC5_BH09BAC5_00500 [soil metagenome]